MATTRNQPEPEEPMSARALRVANEVVAGQSAVRTTLLYAALFVGMFIGVALWPALLVSAAAAVLLMASDGRLG